MSMWLWNDPLFQGDLKLASKIPYLQYYWQLPINSHPQMFSNLNIFLLCFLNQRVGILDLFIWQYPQQALPLDHYIRLYQIDKDYIRDVRPVQVLMNCLLLGYRIKNKLPVILVLVTLWLMLQQQNAGVPLVTWFLIITLTTVSINNFLILIVLS